MAKIYFDMDGVLADFEGYVRDHGIPYFPQANYLSAQDETMWDAIKQVPHFYLQLEPIDGAIDLFMSVKNQKEHRSEILSAIPKPKWGLENTKEDKLEWVSQHLGDDVKANIVYREEKQEYCTGKDCILIDDLPKNIEEWELKGGTGILFKDVESTRKELNEVLAMFNKTTNKTAFERMKSMLHDDTNVVEQEMIVYD